MKMGSVGLPYADTFMVTFRMQSFGPLRMPVYKAMLWGSSTGLDMTSFHLLVPLLKVLLGSISLLTVLRDLFQYIT